MLEDELQDLIRKGEGAELEFRRDADKNGSTLKPEKMAKLITAFANTDGGKILLGVDDDGSISGVRRKNMLAWLTDTVIRRYIYPSITINYSEVQVKGKSVAVVTVPQGADKPYVVMAANGNREDYYVRQGDTCQHPRRDEMLRLFAASGALSVEMMMAYGCEISELDAEMTKEHFMKVHKVKEKTWKKNREKILHNRQFTMQDAVSGKAFLTRFACALFATNPCRYLPQAGVRVVVFDNKKGDDRTIIRVDKKIERPILGRYDDPVDIIKKAQDVLNPHIRREEPPDTSIAPDRRVIYDYPPAVLRELLANAIAHRDWTRPNMVEVALYSDCIEVFSPGKLPDDMTVEKMKAGIRVPRNQKMLSIMQHYNLVEEVGLGIQGLVIPEMKRKNGAEPQFEATDMYLKVVLPKRVED